MAAPVDSGERRLTPGEVAAMFRVDPKTVTRWAAAGRIGSIRNPGGHRRFREAEVRALLQGGSTAVTAPTRIPSQAPSTATSPAGSSSQATSHVPPHIPVQGGLDPVPTSPR